MDRMAILAKMQKRHEGKSERGVQQPPPTAVQKARNGDIRFQFPSANITSRLTRPLARGDSLCERVQFVRL